MRISDHNAALLYFKRQTIWHSCWTLVDAIITIVSFWIGHGYAQGVWQTCILIMSGVMLFRTYFHGRKAWQFGYYLWKRMPTLLDKE